MAESPPNLHRMVSRWSCIQVVLKVKVKVHVIRALSWILGMSYSVIDGLVELLRAKCMPVLLYATEVCQMLSRDKQSLEFTCTLTRLFMKIFRTASPMWLWNANVILINKCIAGLIVYLLHDKLFAIYHCTKKILSLHIFSINHCIFCVPNVKNALFPTLHFQHPLMAKSQFPTVLYAATLCDWS